MKCPYCAEQVPDDAKLCGHCRRHLVLPCPGCGREVPAVDVKCDSCGMELTMLKMPTQAPSASAGSRPHPRKGSCGCLLVLLFLLGVVVILVTRGDLEPWFERLGEYTSGLEDKIDEVVPEIIPDLAPAPRPHVPKDPGPFGAAPAPSTEAPVRAEDSLTSAQKIALINRIKKHCVVVFATSTDDGSAFKGSGIAIRRFGDWVVIVTNAHVVKNGGFIHKQMGVKLRSGKQQPACLMRIIYSDEAQVDLAFLAVDDSGRELEVASVNEDVTPARGDLVFAVGNPQEEEFFVDDGAIQGVKGHLIDHDAIIEHGSSGGGLFDSRGKLIGINTWISDDRIGRAIDMRQVAGHFSFHKSTAQAGKAEWQDSGVEVKPGDLVSILSTGRWRFSPKYKPISGAGVRGIEEGSIEKSQGHGALLCKVKGAAKVRGVAYAWLAAEATVVKWQDASMVEFKPEAKGTLQFRINDKDVANNSGQLDVFIMVTR
jgi:S1-C subfamily serine protease